MSHTGMRSLAEQDMTLAQLDASSAHLDGVRPESELCMG